jgi:UDP-4-amino-4,6-dideoxy-N-acetyl-beta-L-altrosamine transaminase
MGTRRIPYGRQWIEPEDIAAVVEVLQSDWITQGECIGRFEAELAAYCGARYAVAVSSATAALHLACLAVELSAGDPIVTSPITFAASANCGVYCRAQPYFADIDPRTYNLNPVRLEEQLQSLPTDIRPGVVIPVHFAGQCCDMSAISGISRQRGLRIIEDASHALGSHWIDGEGVRQQVGNCSHSDMTVFSFHPVKNITTGEGGAIMTNDEELYEKLLRLRNHGIARGTDCRAVCDDPWYYEMQDLGFNYRITDFQCALGSSQLKKLDKWVERRREIAGVYDEALQKLDEVVTPFQRQGSYSAYHLYVVRVSTGAETRRRVFDRLREEGIGVQVHYVPVHQHPYYQQNFGYRPGDFPVAEAYYEECLSLPVYPKMSADDVQYVVDAFMSAVASAD